jgi:hypothetical protein
MSRKTTVKTVVCPEISLPSHLLKSQSSSSSSSSRARNDVRKEPTEQGSTKEELRSMMTDIKKFNTSMEFGKTKRKTIDDKLTSLGALPAKAQRMPLKLKINLQNFRKKRDEKQLQESKASQVINEKFAAVARKNKISKREKGKGKGKR